MENFLGGDPPKEDYIQNSLNSEFNRKKAHINMGFFILKFFKKSSNEFQL